MKEYIAPALYNINVEIEGSLLIASNNIHNEQSTSPQLSRQRFTDCSNWSAESIEEDLFDE